jgi:hypothetical protein
MFDTAGMVGDIVGSASHGARSTDHVFANTPDIAATANTADSVNTVDTEHPNMDRSSRGHISAPEGHGRPRQTQPVV